MPSGQRALFFGATAMTTTVDGEFWGTILKSSSSNSFLTVSSIVKRKRNRAYKGNLFKGRDSKNGVYSLSVLAF
jgi:hypothetical protein